MKQWLQTIKTGLDTPAALYASVLVAIANKCLIAHAYTSLQGDKALYLLLSKGLLTTGKLLEPVNAVETGATVHSYEPAMHSPFYSLLAAPFLAMTGSYVVTQLIMTIISWIIFYTALAAVASLILKPRWLVTAFILGSAFFIYPHELSSTVKDTFAVGLSLAAVALMHRWLQQPKWTTTLLSALCLLALAQTKLLYVPLTAVLIFLLFVLQLLKKNRQHFVQFCLLVAVVLVGAWLTSYLLLEPAKAVAQLAPVGVPSNTTDLTVGFSPGYLLHTFPFVSSSVVNTHLWAVQAGKLPGISFTAAMRTFLYADAAVLVILLGGSFYYSRQLLSANALLILIIASFTMTAVVVMLSLTGNIVLYKSGGPAWTYVMDARSFLLPMVVLQLLLFRFIFLERRWQVVRIILAALFLLTVVHGLYFSVKETIATPTQPKPELAANSLDNIVSLVWASGTPRAALVTSDNFLRRYAQVKDLRAYSFTSLPPQFSWIKKGDRFIIATYPADSALLKKFPQGQLQPLDTIPPFTLHAYEVK
jgi:hypothetical protein